MIMTPIIFWDTETSGLPLWREPSDHPGQPHIVQIGAVMVDIDTDRALQTLDLTIRPNGWAIPEEVAVIHGITTEHAETVGVPEPVALQVLLDMLRVGRLGAVPAVAFNNDFDARILRIGLHRHGFGKLAEAWETHPVECAMKQAAPIMSLPPTPKQRAAGFSRKNPNLGEAVRHFLGREPTGAHTAIGDATDCWHVWRAMNPRVSAAATTTPAKATE